MSILRKRWPSPFGKTEASCLVNRDPYFETNLLCGSMKWLPIRRYALNDAVIPGSHELVWRVFYSEMNSPCQMSTSLSPLMCVPTVANWAACAPTYLRAPTSKTLHKQCCATGGFLTTLLYVMHSPNERLYANAAFYGSVGFCPRGFPCSIQAL